MRRRIGLVAAAAILTFSSFGFSPKMDVAHANSELKQQISDVQREQQQNSEKATQTEAELEKIEAELESVNAEMQEIDEQMSETNQKIREKRGEIEETRAHIEELQEEIAILEERIAERDELLKDRARSMYQSGGSIDYLEVILGSKDFGDFLDRVSALTVIAQQDRSILEAHMEDHLALEEAKETVESELANLEQQLIELEELSAELEAQRQEKDRLLGQLEQKEGELHTDLGNLDNENEILKQQQAALEQQLAEYEAEQERKRQEEEKRKAEEAAAAAAASQQSTSRSSGSSSNSSSSSNASNNTQHSAPAVTNSGFMRPATGTITSTYGPRATFGGRMHHGIDIGKNGRTGDVPIVAVADGQVVQSYYSSSYGNTVLISHMVNGQQITTLYAHLENREVSTGDRVSKGQRLGMMGNTGRSFGPHLHFEVHEGGWNNAKSNSVDPLKYIPR
ncbi:peptidoglycan DD-metalloendopeptidase family protein [Alkalihalophilus pseudofirmus]|uniref:murein hydrolase activator EnvC family protein n=1 Tax=Alkalihalophilus pseudofirmus TaxID=79885 RepID=UPI00259B2447|nr:peptidoglycan DD-metalloendopeptidase family protein [Alkalihalophilus pseudofirmus]WEG16538.1 peptidoglycan DD-metalloendopeptidase family protein [Alkalihalophilus pseudofirmus]